MQDPNNGQPFKNILLWILLLLLVFAAPVILVLLFSSF